MSAIYDTEVTTLGGDKHTLDAYRGKVLVIVNVASKCGFTPQYKGLEELHEKYADKGFAVLGFPCNQFGKQEPGNADEIQNFCTTNYGVSFPMHEKIEVNGEGAHPLYQHLKGEKPGLMGTKNIKWNFTKFVVGKNGEVVSRHAPSTKPKELEGLIEKLLNA
ncbi:MAG: glutathione peroxidase [Myxococcota bacterium]